MEMRSYIARKMLYLLITLMVIIAFNFFLFRIMPGDPARVLVPKGASPEIVQYIREKYHLNDPLSTQFYTYIIQVFTLDFGKSFSTMKGAVITDFLGNRVFNTVLLVGTGTLLAIVLGIAIGKFAAWRRGKPADAISMSFALVFYSMPTFLFALIMLMIFGGWLGWFPLKGAVSVDYPSMNVVGKIGDRIYHLILPVIAFTLEIMADFALIMRNSLTDVLTEDYITTARAKGVSNKTLLNEHAMPNAMLPVVTVIAISIGWVLGGAIMVEIVFSYDGLGKLTWDAVNDLDYPLLQCLFLIMAIAVLAANFVADIVYTYLDPRVKI
ncbi:MAG: ABC transporter permease [Thermoplasmata archaeon]